MRGVVTLVALELELDVTALTAEVDDDVLPAGLLTDATVAVPERVAPPSVNSTSASPSATTANTAVNKEILRLSRRAMRKSPLKI